MDNIRFAVVGGGWRTLFFLRIAKSLPEQFTVTSILVRNLEKGATLTREWGVHTCQTIDDLLATKPEFVVVSIAWDVTPVLVKELHDRGIPVLSETPPAPDLERLTKLYQDTDNGSMVQVAEQYHLQPTNAARIALAISGILGTVTQAQVSLAHGYHGISMMRRLLGIAFRSVSITARNFSAPIVAGPTRMGPPEKESIDQEVQTMAWFDFDGKLGVFDFSGSQYFSWVRSYRVLVRGSKGELNMNTVKYLKDYRTPITLQLMRQDKGLDNNHEAYSHRGITFGDRWIYENPTYPARLTDDEIAVATCLLKMHEYVEGGPDLYSLADACQDHYLGLMMNQAAETGAKVMTQSQVWSSP